MTAKETIDQLAKAHGLRIEWFMCLHPIPHCVHTEANVMDKCYTRGEVVPEFLMQAWNAKREEEEAEKAAEVWNAGIDSMGEDA